MGKSGHHTSCSGIRRTDQPKAIEEEINEDGVLGRGGEAGGGGVEAGDAPVWDRRRQSTMNGVTGAIAVKQGVEI